MKKAASVLCIFLFARLHGVASTHVDTIPGGRVYPKDMDTSAAKKIGNLSWKDSTRFAVHQKTPPMYPGGQEVLFKDLAKNTRIPRRSQKKGLAAGSVTVSFVINEDGSVDNIEITRGEEMGREYTNAAIQAVRNLPGKFTPGMINGHPIKSTLSVPVLFVSEKELMYDRDFRQKK